MKYEIKYHDDLSGTEYNTWHCREDNLGDRIKILQEQGCKIIEVKIEEKK